MNDMVYVPELEDGEVLEITKRKKFREPLPPFNMVGNGMTNRYGTSMDIIEVCLQLSLAEIKLLQFFRDCYARNIMNKEENTNVVTPAKWDKFDKYLAKALEKSYKNLEEKRVLCRIKRGIYIVNPNLFVPQQNFVLINAQWQTAIDTNIKKKETK